MTRYTLCVFIEQNYARYQKLERPNRLNSKDSRIREYVGAILLLYFGFIIGRHNKSRMYNHNPAII